MIKSNIYKYGPNLFGSRNLEFDFSHILMQLEKKYIKFVERLLVVIHI